MELPNITIGKIKSNEESWRNLLDNFKPIFNIDLNYNERIILGEFCNRLHVEDWRNKEQDLVIVECMLQLKKELENIRK